MSLFPQLSAVCARITSCLPLASIFAVSPQNVLVWGKFRAFVLDMGNCLIYCIIDAEQLRHLLIPKVTLQFLANGWSCTASIVLSVSLFNILFLSQSRLCFPAISVVVTWNCCIMFHVLFAFLSLIFHFLLFPMHPHSLQYQGFLTLGEFDAWEVFHTYQSLSFICSLHKETINVAWWVPCIVRRFLVFLTNFSSVHFRIPAPYRATALACKFTAEIIFLALGFEVNIFLTCHRYSF